VSDRASGIEGYLEFLRSLLARCAAQFLFGGQAVNFWADYFDRKADAKELHALRPFTSKDCDIWVSHQAWTEILETESSRLVKGFLQPTGNLEY
jgi:hypothetical protein